MVNCTAIILGFILAKLLSIVLGIFTGSWGFIVIDGFVAYFLATVYVGNYVGEDYINGAIHGALLVTFGLIISMVSSLFSIPYFGWESFIQGTMIYNLILGCILYIIVGSFGGALGVFLIDYLIDFNYSIRSGGFLKDRWLIKDSLRFIKSVLKSVLINLGKFVLRNLQIVTMTIRNRARE